MLGSLEELGCTLINKMKAQRCGFPTMTSDWDVTQWDCGMCKALDSMSSLELTMGSPASVS